jgi:hypothetical protein
MFSSRARLAMIATESDIALTIVTLNTVSRGNQLSSI